MNRTKILRFVASIVICSAAGGIGSLFTMPSIHGWYSNLIKPYFNPPNWLFAPVWTVLFFLMGVSLYLAWVKRDWFGVRIFAVQLFLNVLWSVLFFGLHLPWLAFFEIVFLWISIIATIIRFRYFSRTAASLMVPYLAWVSFAALLNLTIAILN
jgi:translocator protein